MRPGGVANMLRAISYAEMEGMGSVLHNQAMGIASAMHIHKVPTGPGWGLELDEAALEKYATGPTVVIESLDVGAEAWLVRAGTQVPPRGNGSGVGVDLRVYPSKGMDYARFADE